MNMCIIYIEIIRLLNSYYSLFKKLFCYVVLDEVVCVQNILLTFGNIELASSRNVYVIVDQGNL